ncbi:MAG: hypothetical protein ACYDAC_11220 [Candidatus Dormibacteria bacterium]
MSRDNRRRAATAASGAPAAATPAATPLAEGRQISWRWCAAGLLAGELMLLVVSNLGLGIANAVFGSGGFQAADGGIVGVATFLSVLSGGYIAARGARRFGLYQGVVVGIGFIVIGALYQFGQEASLVHSSLASGTHTLIDLGPMSMGNLITGDLLALVGGSIGGLLSRQR